MSEFDAELTLRLEAIRAHGFHRELRRVDSPQRERIKLAGKSLVNFSSNDYLGLANAPQIKEAVIKAVRRFGAGSGASRLICGSLAPHHQLEESLAAFKNTPAALTFSSGYATALGTICALLGKEDILIIDRLVHACVVDAARLCGAKLRVFAHNDLNDLEAKLKWADARGRPGQKKSSVLVVTESVFSMDGDLAPLREIVDLKERYGACLMVDEAHATGLFGRNRRGLAEHCGVGGRIDIQMGTLGKALGSAGGFICGSRVLIDYLVNRARSFIFSTAPTPAAAAGATAAIELIRSAQGEARRRRLWECVRKFCTSSGLDPSASTSAIVPIHIGDETCAMQAADFLRERGFLVPAIRYPTVGRNQSRLRVTVSANHTFPQIASLGGTLRLLPSSSLPGEAHISSAAPATRTSDVSEILHAKPRST